jgi:hypothetical protein
MSDPTCDHVTDKRFENVIRPRAIGLLGVSELDDAIYVRTDFCTALLRGGSDFAVRYLFQLEDPSVTFARTRIKDFSLEDIFLILRYLHDQEKEINVVEDLVDLVDDAAGGDDATFDTVLREAFHVCNCTWKELRKQRKKLISFRNIQYFKRLEWIHRTRFAD